MDFVVKVVQQKLNNISPTWITLINIGATNHHDLHGVMYILFRFSN